MVRSYLMALTGDPSTVDDLSQEVFLRTIERIHLIQSPSDQPRFLRGVARRVALEFLRERRRGRRYIDATLDSLVADDAGVASLVQHAESLERLREMIEELPIVARRMLELRYHDDLSAHQIGLQLGIEPSAVRVTLLRIRERLRKRLTADGRQ